MSDSQNPFHDHLDICEQCRNHPFGLCKVGMNIIQNMVLSKGASATINLDPNKIPRSFK